MQYIKNTGFWFLAAFFALMMIVWIGAAKVQSAYRFIKSHVFRKPDVIIGVDYLYRWWVIPRNRFFNVYLHKFCRSDDDRALHDHPWYSVSFLLRGEMLEHSFAGKRHIRWMLPIFRTAKFAHRLEIVKGPVWTVFITGPRIRKWGFYCPTGWRYWREFTTPDGSTIGKGCD